MRYVGNKAKNCPGVTGLPFMAGFWVYLVVRQGVGVASLTASVKLGGPGYIADPAWVVKLIEIHIT